MLRSTLCIVLIAALFSSCATLEKKIDKYGLNPVSKIYIYSYDEEGKISIFVPPELTGVKVWGSFAASYTLDADNSSLEQVVNCILSPWDFNEYLLHQLETSINDHCRKFPIIRSEGIMLATAKKNLIPENIDTIRENSDFIRKLSAYAFDALILLKLRYYGPHTSTAFAKCQLRCAIDIQLISIPTLKILWKDRINLERIKSDEILFQLTMYEYIENNCKNLKTALEKAAETISNEVCNNLCY